ncbi:MAG: DUF2163 domain-containing protein [Rhodobacteraceae bacterium]|nr:DUF2163 domain-containing protein [Paracoccaceae bacterium]
MSGTIAAHLAGGVTTVCRAWAVRRRDGVEQGFTDHDRDLVFEGVTFRAATGMTARALQQTSGLAVDNSEAGGVLSDAAVTEADIVAGRYDGAAVRVWRVNWADAEERALIFSGTLGEVVRARGAFRAELRGLTEALNAPQGALFQRPCAAVLGDGRCRFDLSQAGYAAEVAVETVTGGRLFRFADFTGFDDRWFEAGRLEILSGAAAGLVGVVKNDRLSAAGREVELWQGLGDVVAPGDAIRLEAGCDKRLETCQLKFDNVLNFRGFPDIPGDDWLAAVPARAGGAKDGGSLGRRPPWP